MQTMKFFIDTHDQKQQTFPAGLTSEQFEVFFAGFEQACLAEGVVLLRAHIGLADGRAFCFTMALRAQPVDATHALNLSAGVS